MRRSLVAAMILLFGLASCGGGGGGGGDDGLIDVYFQNDAIPVSGVVNVAEVGYVGFDEVGPGGPDPDDYTWRDLSADPIAFGERAFGFRVPARVTGYYLVMTTSSGGWHPVYTGGALTDLVFVLDDTGYHIEDPWTYPGGPPP